MTLETTARLERLDALFREKVPELAATLRPPAKRATLNKLRNLFDGDLPADVEAWFLWHNGQTGMGPEPLIPGQDWTALSCADAVENHRLLTKAEPDDDDGYRFDPLWIPLFDDGCGNYLCLDRKTGALRAWYHDEASRPKPFKSLAALIEALERSYARFKRPQGLPAPPATIRWQPVALPSPAKLEKLPPGAALTATMPAPMKSSYAVLRVRLGPNHWLECTEVTLEKAVEDWRKASIRPPSKASRRYGTDFSVRFELKQCKKPVRLALPS